MSLGYAQKLSYREDVGNVGMSEIFDSPFVLHQKIEQLAVLIQKSKHLVAFTGAGISTSCGKGVPEASLPFDRAVPSLTHMALVELEKAGILKFVISQNVDSLHLRSGIPREILAELHGNSFREICRSCDAEYLRDFEVETVGMKETPRRCSNAQCQSKLTDSVLDWEDALPPKEMDPAERHCTMADVVLCLGTSLQITPACNLPLRCLHGGGKMVVVNLQKTPKDKKASLVIHGLVDKVIAGVMQLLNLKIHPYVRMDLVQLSLTQFPKKNRYVTWTLRVGSVHGHKAPLPFLKSVEISFPDRLDLEPAILCVQPFSLKRMTLKTRPFNMVLIFNFVDGCGCLSSRIEWPLNFEVSRGSFCHDRTLVFEKLRVSAIQDLSCGQYAVIERRNLLEPKTEIASYCIVTNIQTYNYPASPIVFGHIPKGNRKMTKRPREANLGMFQQ